MVMLGQQEEIREFKSRYPVAHAVIIMCFFLLLVRVWYLQILTGKEHYLFSQQQSLRQEKIPAPRGIMIDRYGLPLIDNIPSFNIALIPQFIRDREETIKQVSQLLDLDPAIIDATLYKFRKDPPFQPVIIKADASRDEVARVETQTLDIPALEVQVGIKRKYLYGEIGAHVLGTLGQINDNELLGFKTKGVLKYDQFAFIGKTGLEKEWEDVLSGVDGGAFVAVDARGYRRQEHEKNIFGYLATQEEQPGNNLILTIDQDLQREAYKAMQNKIGSIVALDPQTGQVLAMLSQPSFDPTTFSIGISAEEWEALVNNPYKPLKNKAIGDHYPPGSTYKPINAIAALETDKVTPDVKYHCNGTFSYMRGLYRCWKKEGHGSISLHRAIQESCDVYFYNVGVQVGIDALSQYAQLFGMGAKTGIKLDHEQPGLSPTRKWRENRFGSPWIPGETVSNAIGQGFNLITTLQLANFYAAIGTEGKLYRPYVIQRIEDPHGKVLEEFDPELIREIKLKPETIKNVKQGLWEVVNKPGGTAYYRSRIPDLDICGKTGTAQVIRLKEEDRGKKCEEIDFAFRDHALFAAWAPRDNPEIAVAVIVEHGCHGSSAAAPVAKEIIEAYFHKKRRLKELQKQGPREEIKGAEL